MSLPSNFVSCPGLFYGTSARDGILSRIRVPGGILTSQQFRVLADLADEFGSAYIHITNRANVQVREIGKEITADYILKRLQEFGIAAAIPEVDHLRNIMGSPTAGIDAYELIDTRSLIRELDNYISTSLDIAELSPKFSVGFDGGGSVSIGDRPNDIAFTAVLVDTQVYFRLKLSVGTSQEKPFLDVGVLLLPKECLEFVAALAKVYLQHMALGAKNIIPHRRSSKPRVRDVVNELGMERFLQEVERYLSYPLRPVPVDRETRESGEMGKTRERDSSLSSLSSLSPHSPQVNTTRYRHVGIHPQRQKGLFYIGVAIPVGQLSTGQIRGLADICETYGSGTLRLTPWQNLLLSDIPQQWVSTTQSQIENLGLHWSATNIRSGLVACAGSRGCVSSATDTKGHALALSEYLDKRLTLDQPINIHFTGCEKSCAQHSKSDITLLGVTIEQEGTTVEGYKVYVGDGEEKFGREYQWIPFAELPLLIERMLQIYMAKRATPKESFREFINRNN